jgi:hypothetical protein
MRNQIFWARSHNRTEISVSKMMNVLANHGIRRYYVSSESISKPVFVEVISNKVKLIDEAYMLEILQSIIKKLGNREIMETFLRMRGILSFERLSSLPKLESSFLRDTRSCSYFFFRNKVGKVTRDQIELIPYEHVKGLIWMSQIINHDLELIAVDTTRKNLSFYKFLVDITAHETVNSESRLLHLQTLIGYLLHEYKDPINPKAVVLMDENLSEKPEGGTGKTLIADAIGKMRKITMEDGKNFRPNERFAFQQVEPDTKIILFDDLIKDFVFERIFPAVTSGLSVEKKQKDKYSIPFERSPKILITTNYAISGTGASFRRRLYEFELSQYFNDNQTPTKVYGKPFFVQWTAKEWSMFYCLMMECTSLYLKDGVKVSKAINIEYKKLLNVLPKPLIDYFDTIIRGKEYNRHNIFAGFKRMNSDFSDMSQHLFSGYLNTYADVLNLEILPRKSGDNQYFRLIPKNSTLFPSERFT